MEPLLYLVHRIPYPPNKGDKIRSFHWLKGLAKHYDIYLATYVDDENDWQYVELLNEYCAEVHAEKLTPPVAKIKSLTGFLKGTALSLPYYGSKRMQSWVDRTISAHCINKMLIFSSSMAQFIHSPQYDDSYRVIDFVDMDSDKWMQYAEKKSWPMSWVYRREAKTLFDYEKNVSVKMNKSLFVSQKEAELFKTRAHNNNENIDFVNNGVNTDYFSPLTSFINPFPQKSKTIVFTGAMDYWANVDAVIWFSKEIFPSIKAQQQDAMFFIVGSKPTMEVLALAEINGIHVTGFVDDVRPYLKYADVVVAPMRIARGIQNKVLEAMSMAKTVVVSRQGFEGLKADPAKELILVNTHEEWVNRILKEIQLPDCQVGHLARIHVKGYYSWKSNVDKLSGYFQGCSHGKVSD